VIGTRFAASGQPQGSPGPTIGADEAAGPSRENRSNVNQRRDGWGGTIQTCNGFALEVAQACAGAIGAGRVGIRLSPHGAFNATCTYPEVDAQYEALVTQLSALCLFYVHLLDHSALGAPAAPAALKRSLRTLFDGPFIRACGFDAASAEAALQAGDADLVGFARPFLANPGLARRMQTGAALNAPDMATFYTADAKGDTDYPALEG
jgi:N-ethylmaleimide reductase